uniref:Uncharacterized protein n=1 Tax=Avena sativa TaxID=4498 RepID=A0ACD6ABK2_AVESA
MYVRELVKRRPAVGPSGPVEEVVRRVFGGELDLDEGRVLHRGNDLRLFCERDLVAVVEAVDAEIGEARRISEDEGNLDGEARCRQGSRGGFVPETADECRRVEETPVVRAGVPRARWRELRGAVEGGHRRRLGLGIEDRVHLPTDGARDLGSFSSVKLKPPPDSLRRVEESAPIESSNPQPPIDRGERNRSSPIPGSTRSLAPAAGSSRFPNFFLLDTRATISDLRNETTASALTAGGLTIQASFVFADPPRLSYLCVYCLSLRNEIAFANAPKVVSSAEDTALIRVILTTEKSLQYFLYGARGPNGAPSLDLLPDTRQYSLKEIIFQPLGFVSHDKSTQLVMAALSYGPSNGQYYNLHTLGSDPHSSTWSKKLLRVEIPDGLPVKSAVIYPNKVISLGGGLLGWVDLWKGIVICDVLDPGAATASFVPMPSNYELYGNHYSARPIRDVTFSGGYIKCVEFEELVKLRPTALPADPWDMDELRDSELAIVPPRDEEEVYDVVGWRLITWYRALTWNGWRKGTMVHSDDIGTVSLPQLAGGACAHLNVSFKDLKTGSPTLRGGDDDVIYLVSMLDENDQTAWIVTVDTKRKTLGEVIPFHAEHSSIYDPPFVPCVLAKYLDAKSDGARLGMRNPCDAAPQNFNRCEKKRQRLSQSEPEEQPPVPQFLQPS